ncbi:MAG: CpsD/CapB family tyrosine-protein kinase [Pseudomonadota bacterium]
MPERLKAAIEKARQARSGLYGHDARISGASSAARALESEDAVAAEGAPMDVVQRWAALQEVKPDISAMRRHRIVTHQKTDAAHYSFDVLRTRILMMFRDNGWTRLGVTSPSLGCGKTMFSANLALSCARQTETRVALTDMDLRSPRLADCFGVTEERVLEWYLAGQTPAETFLRRVGNNLALCLNSTVVRHSAEITQSERTSRTLDALHSDYEPDISLFDLPPLLYGDDALAFLPNLDAVVLVAAAGQSKASEIDEAERQLSETTNFLGVVLNKTREKDPHAEMYGY